MKRRITVVKQTVASNEKQQVFGSTGMNKVCANSYRNKKPNSVLNSDGSSQVVCIRSFVHTARLHEWIQHKKKELTSDEEISFRSSPLKISRCVSRNTRGQDHVWRCAYLAVDSIGYFDGTRIASYSSSWDTLLCIPECHHKYMLFHVQNHAIWANGETLESHSAE